MLDIVKLQLVRFNLNGPFDRWIDFIVELVQHTQIGRLLILPLEYV